MFRKGTCRHYRVAMEFDTCEAGVEYAQFSGLPCFAKWKSHGQCARYEEPTADEVSESEAKSKASAKRITDALNAGKSPCCMADLDESRVIRSGPHKGHGPRFCTACHRVAFMV